MIGLTNWKIFNPWQNNLDAQILVVGQDSCDECTCIKTKAKVERFPHRYEYPSNVKQRNPALLASARVFPPMP